MDFLKQISSFKSDVKEELIENDITQQELSFMASSEQKLRDPEFLLETILGFVSRHYSHILVLSSSFSIIFTLYIIFLSIRFLYKEKRLRRGTPEYHQLLKTVHSAAQRACWAGNTDLVKFMIQQGVDIGMTNINGDNAFFLAAYKQSKKKMDDWNPDILSALLNAGMDINSQNERGHTALHVAAKEGHVLLTQWLLSHGADPDAGNGTHPLDVAHAYNDEKHREVADMLAKYSNKPLQDFEELVEFTAEGRNSKFLPSFFFQPDFLQ
nr:PREDICTED: ankyrin-1-like isoform X2 [Bemisia tabaci]